MFNSFVKGPKVVRSDHFWSQPKLLTVVGPTASGKTALAERLAREFHGEVVTADSRTVYRGLDIGTAKARGVRVRAGEYAGAVFAHGAHHWLIDLVDPDQPFTVADWKAAALAVIGKILERGHLPIVVGGTGLYVRTLVDNLEPPAIAPDENLRSELEVKPLFELVALLKQHDPEAAKIVDLKNPRRVIRALEVVIISGAPFDSQRKKSAPLFDALQIGIDLPRQELYDRIDRRVDEQVRAGLFEEVEQLVARYGGDLPALSAIGYRQIRDRISTGRSDLASRAEVIQRIKFDTHAYARRQLTWLRRDQRIKWVKNAGEAEKFVRQFLLKPNRS